MSQRTRRTDVALLLTLKRQDPEIACLSNWHPSTTKCCIFKPVHVMPLGVWQPSNTQSRNSRMATSLKGADPVTSTLRPSAMQFSNVHDSKYLSHDEMLPRFIRPYVLLWEGESTTWLSRNRQSRYQIRFVLLVWIRTRPSSEVTMLSLNSHPSILTSIEAGYSPYLSSWQTITSCFSVVWLEKVLFHKCNWHEKAVWCGRYIKKQWQLLLLVQFLKLHASITQKIRGLLSTTRIVIAPACILWYGLHLLWHPSNMHDVILMFGVPSITAAAAEPFKPTRSRKIHESTVILPKVCPAEIRPMPAPVSPLLSCTLFWNVQLCNFSAGPRESPLIDKYVPT